MQLTFLQKNKLQIFHTGLNSKPPTCKSLCHLKIFALVSCVGKLIDRLWEKSATFPKNIDYQKFCSSLKTCWIGSIKVLIDSFQLLLNQSNEKLLILFLASEA